MRRCWQVDSQDVDTLKWFSNYRNQKQEVAPLLSSQLPQWESEANGPSVEDVPCKTGAEKNDMKKWSESEIEPVCKMLIYSNEPSE